MFLCIDEHSGRKYILKGHLVVLPLIVTVSVLSGCFSESYLSLENRPLAETDNEGPKQEPEEEGEQSGSSGDGIAIDVSKATGSFQNVFRPGVWGITFDPHPSYAYDKYAKEMQLGDFRDTVGMEWIPGKDKTEFLSNLKVRLQWKADIFEKIKENGGQPHFELAQMPQWLTSCPEFTLKISPHHDVFWNTCPPKSYSDWADVVSFTVNYFKNVRGLDVVYSIWSGEADWLHWSGTEEDFFKLYQYSVLGARKIDPNAKIGTGFLFLEGEHHAHYVNGTIYDKAKASGKGSMFKNFVQFCSQSVLPELGYSRLPIDFVEHHHFLTEPFGGYWKDASALARSTLQGNGYEAQVPLYFEYSHPDDIIPENHGNEVAASFIPATLYDMAQAGGEVWPMYNAFFGTRNSPSAWDVGLFSKDFSPNSKEKDYVIRASYNTMLVLSKLLGKDDSSSPVQLETPDLREDFLTVLASIYYDGNVLRTLVSSYIPTGRVEIEYLWRIFSKTPSMESTEEYRNQIADCNEDPACIEVVVNSIEDPVLQERLRSQMKLHVCIMRTNDFKGCAQEVQSETTDPVLKEDCSYIISEQDRVDGLKTQNRETTLFFSKIPFSGKANLVSYTVDKEHSNSCSYNKLTGSEGGVRRCGTLGAVDQMLAQAQKEAFEQAHEVPQDEQKVCEEQLLFFGEYVAKSGERLQTSIWEEKINQDPNIALEGSKTVKEVYIENGTLTVPVEVQPYSVTLFEIVPAKE